MFCMEVLTKRKVLRDVESFVVEIKSGKIFVYPTDTIYGIGCSALVSRSVGKIREMKKRDAKPFSVIAPSEEWIRENCVVDGKVERWLSKLPGPYTLILKLKNKACVSGKVNASGESLGVRIPKHWVSEIVEKTGVPFVTTSVNLSGEKPLSNIGDLKKGMEEGVDYFIDVGEIEGAPSTVVDLTSESGKIIRR